jgi:hypothetical protein
MTSLFSKTGMWFGPLCITWAVTIMRKWKWLFVMAVLGLLDPGGEVCDPSELKELHAQQHSHVSDGVSL